MSLGRRLLMRAFGRPQGWLGRVGGVVMARMNTDRSAWVTDLLDIRPTDGILEVGFGPGVVIAQLLQLVPDGSVAGVDPSPEMLAQAQRRTGSAAAAVDLPQVGRVDLREGTAASLPFADGRFDKALAINSMQVWPDAIGGLREIARVLKRDGTVAVGFTPQSGQPRAGITDTLIAAGFIEARLVETNRGFCALARKP